MAKGRKPNRLAQCHNAPQELAAHPIDAQTGVEIKMPEQLSFLPAAEECWHMITDGQTRFSTYEVPLLEQYCMAYAAARQAQLEMIDVANGRLEVVTRPEGGKPFRNPAFNAWKDATDKMRQLSGVLGLDTLTAERLNLTRAAAVSMSLDIPTKIREAARNALNGN